ncbi:hypothetical protein FACS189490_03930 [Clostridia bacterium]|nr:hypothetical protein FACS189490_03930 [Clostridia bacterium]
MSERKKTEPKKAEPSENGEAMWRGCCADYGVITARMVCREYLKLGWSALEPAQNPAGSKTRLLAMRPEKFTAHAGELAFISELRDAMAAAPNLTDVPVYLHNRGFAELCGEEALYEASEQTNRRCADDIDAAIHACEYGDGTYAFDRAINALRDQYGLERVSLVLAAEVQWLGMVVRVSKDAHKWARGRNLGDHFYGGYHLRTNPDVLEKLIGELRKAMETERETPVVGAREDDMMVNNFPSKEQVARLREQYPEGTRVELISMDDPYSKLKPGDRGSVGAIDDTGTIFVDWDRGSGLGLLYGVDSFKRVERELAYTTGADMWSDTAANHGIDEAAAICGRYLDMNLRRDHSDKERKFCRELFGAMFEATAGRTDPGKIVYPCDFLEAEQLMAVPLYHASRKQNTACSRAIDEAIRASCYAVNYYNLEIAAMVAVREYGFERVNAVLAYHIQRHSSDGRISRANKDWASDFQLPERAFGNAALNAHAILIEDFARYARKMYAELNAERFALPGREESGEINADYEIIRAITFSDKSGYAIGRNPEYADEYVTWQFKIRDGARNYNHGYYCDNMKAAADDYLARVAVYMSDGTREIPNLIAAVEVNAKQNLNMIDGIHNNAPSIAPSAEQPKPEPVRADGYTSVLAAIEKGKTAPKPPRKVKSRSKAKTKDGDEI